MLLSGADSVPTRVANDVGSCESKLIIHLSDLHFGRVNWSIVPELLCDLERLKPYLIIIGGDLVQRPSHRQFCQARDFLLALPSPYLVIPGNHDIPVYNLIRRLVWPFHRYQCYICPQLDPYYLCDSLAVVGINTACAFNLNFAHGRVGRGKLRRLTKLLNSMPDHLFKIAVTHHPLLAPSGTPTSMHPLSGVSQMACALAAGRVDLVLSGHCHKAYIGDLSQSFPGIGRSILVSQAGSATSTRLRKEPNSYSLITVTDRTIQIETRWWYSGTFKSAEPIAVRQR